MFNARSAKQSRKRQELRGWARVGSSVIPVIVVLFTLIAFLPALDNGFVDWDDNMTLLENPRYRGLTWTQLSWMFTTFYMGHYQPLSWLTFGLDYLLWGTDPFGYHLTNLLLHAANAVLFYFITLRLLSLTISFPSAPNLPALRVASAFAALFFAVHPLRVESVVWATERRDVLSGLFFLATILCYLRATTAPEVLKNPLVKPLGENDKRWRLSAALIVYGLSLLSKASGVTLPMVLLVLDIYPLGRLGGSRGKWFGPTVRRVWLEKLYFLLLAAPFALIAVVAQYESGAMRPYEKYNLLGRMAQTVYGLAFYLWKTLLPLGLSPLYELPRYLWSMSEFFILSAAVVAAITLSLCLLWRRWPAGLASWAYYAVMLSPVLGIFQAGPQLVADRYSYLSCLGWAVLSGAGLAYLWKLRANIGSAGFRVIHGLAAGIIFLFAAMSWQQTKVWRDSESLWRQAVQFAPGRLAHSNLAALLREQGRIREAIEQYRRVLEFSPYNLQAHNDLAILLDEQGKIEEAAEHYHIALQIDPSSFETHYNLGLLLQEQEKFELAAKHFREVMRLRPDHAKGHFSLGTVLANLNQLQQAIDHLQQAVKIKPDFAEAHNNLGQLLAARGELKQATAHFREAVRLEPDFAEAHENLGRALGLEGKKDESAKHLREAVRILKSRTKSGEVR